MAPYTQTIQSIYQALEQGKLAKIIVRLSEQIVVQQAASLPYGGVYHGREGFIHSLSLTLSTWGVYRKVPNLFLTNEDDVTVVGELFLKRKTGGETLALPFIDYWKLKDEKVIEIRMFDWDTAQLLNYLNQAGSEATLGQDPS